MRKSQAIARMAPPAKVCPLSAATTGLGKPYRLSYKSIKRPKKAAMPSRSYVKTSRISKPPEKNRGRPLASYVDRENIYFQGDIDELTFYRRALTAAQIRSIFRAGAHGKCRVNLVSRARQ
jgi:hypothetical protein